MMYLLLVKTHDHIEGESERFRSANK